MLSKGKVAWVSTGGARVGPRGRGPGWGVAWPVGGVTGEGARFREWRGSPRRVGGLAFRGSREGGMLTEVPGSVHSRL